jgi:hypothetical protein
VLALASWGCGDAVAKAKAAPQEGVLGSEAKGEPAGTRVAETPVAIAAATRASLVGALERPASLRRFFEAIARLEAGQTQDDVRVVQFGDSHTAADIETAVIRRALQGRFGDGGRGFVAIGKPWKGYLQEGVRCGMSTEWSPERGKLGKGKFSGDGLYGLAGIGVETHQHGARAWTSPHGPPAPRSPTSSSRTGVRSTSSSTAFASFASRRGTTTSPARFGRST